MTGSSAPDRRATSRRYDALLPALHPLKLVGPVIAADFVVGRRFDGGQGFDARVSPRRMLAWLRSMPSYRAGVPLRVGHGADAGRSFQKGAELIELVDASRVVTYRTRLPFTPEQRRFFVAARPNLLLELVAAPRGALDGQDPLELVRSAAGLENSRIHWSVGPLRASDEAEALRILEGLPRGSHLTLAPLDPGVGGAGLAGLGPAGLVGLGPAGLVGLGPAGLARLEAAALALGHTVTDWTCRFGPGRVGMGFFDVDRVIGQADLARRAHDLITCAGCPSRTRCHAPLDEPALLARLGRELGVLGLTRTAPPERTGPHALRLQVAEPASSGDEAYLSHALGQPVAIALEGGARRGDDRLVEADPAVLRRWYAVGFLPVTELNAAAEKVQEDLARRRTSRGGACELVEP